MATLPWILGSNADDQNEQVRYPEESNLAVLQTNGHRQLFEISRFRLLLFFMYELVQ